MNQSLPDVSIGLVETAWGWVALGWTPQGLCSVELPAPLREAEVALKEGFPWARLEPVPQLYALPILRYFRGEAVSFEFPVHYLGRSGFFVKVWDAARQIPYGRVVTYGQLASMVGSPGAARAVGSAMAANPLPIVVPCHRVVAAGGRLGGYSGGLDWKTRLLKLEGAI